MISRVEYQSGMDTNSLRPTITLDEKRDVVVSLRLSASEIARVEAVRSMISAGSCFRFMAPKTPEMIYNLFVISLESFEKGALRYSRNGNGKDKNNGS